MNPTRAVSDCLVEYSKILQWKCFDADRGKNSAREIREYFVTLSVQPHPENRLGPREDRARRERRQLIGTTPGERSCLTHGRIAKARAGKPRPFFTFGQVTTISAPFGGTLSRLAIASI